MTRANFEHELASLHDEIVEMGSYVETAIEESIQAFQSSDIELCKKLISGDSKVDAMEKKIESRCMWLIVREQPIASDLRKITTALKIITDIERIGDHASDIAELTIELTRHVTEKNGFADSVHIPQMAAAAISMVRDAITAFVNYDTALAKATEEKDDIVDDYFNQIKAELAAMFAKTHANIDSAIDYLQIAKYLERIGDHAVNICEWVRFSETGEHKNTLVF